MYSFEYEMEQIEHKLDLLDDVLNRENTPQNRAIVYGYYFSSVKKSFLARQKGNDKIANMWMALSVIIESESSKKNPAIDFTKKKKKVDKLFKV